jgi:hypothetical protein
MSVFVDKLYDYIQAKRAAGYSYLGYSVYNVTKDDVKMVEECADYFGFRPEWLANLINFESAGTWNPAITNSIGATGLIQFMPTTATSIGTTTAALRQMTFAQQMVYVNKYIYMWYKSFKWLDGAGGVVGNPVKNKMKQTDLYMMIFYPAAVGNPDYKFPAAVQTANNGTKTPMDYYNAAIAYAPFKKLLDLNEIVQESVETVKKNLIPILLITLLAGGIATSIIFRNQIINYFNKT